MSTQPHDDTYAMGRTAEEEQRLQRQAILFERPTWQVFAAAGIAPGMKVLDLGSGAGDVAMLVADMIGTTGSVLGVDSNPTIVETARRRARERGHTNVSFVVGDIQAVPLDDDFDAVVGRTILMYLRDPVVVLRQLVSHLRPGGVAAFYEMDLTVPGTTYPPVDLAQQIRGWIAEAFAYAGVETAMGMKMHQVFVDAGLEAPQMRADAEMGGSRAFVEEFTAYVADSIRSMLPLLVKGGIATEEEVGIETLAARYRDAVLEQGSVLRPYLFVGAWARKG